MKLQEGKISSRDIAKWMRISYDTYRHNKAKKLEILSFYCEFEEVYGGLNIKKVYVDEYQGDIGSIDVKNYLEEIQSKPVHNRISSVAGMTRKLSHSKKEYEGLSESAIEYRLGKAGHIAFGKTNRRDKETQIMTCYSGVYGSREAIWCIKVDDENRYRALTIEEEQLFNEIISEIYAKEPEKIKIKAGLEKQLRKKEITTEEYFQIIDDNKLDSFMDCIFAFRNRTGLMLVNCAEHIIKEDQENFEG